MINKEVFDTLIDKRDSLKEEFNNIEQTLKGLRKLCEHDWKYEGHNHNDTRYVCMICGEVDWR